ncbi:MAG: hypothetical protein AAFX90_10000 [Pseudomonadota bacterium]
MQTDPSVYDVGTEIESREAAHEKWLDSVCHEEQMTIWSGEILGAVSEYIRDDILSHDVIQMHEAVQDELRSIISAATQPR